MGGYGALPAQRIRDMITSGFIIGATAEHVQPASLDLTIGEEAFRVRSVFHPQRGEAVAQAMRVVRPEPHDLRSPLERNITYLIRLNESLVLPADVYGYANPKSSTGRNDIHVRMLADGIRRYDSAGASGFRGDLWALVTPRSFRLQLHPGDSLLQLRFFNQDTRFRSEGELQIAHQMHRLLFTASGEPIEFNELMCDREGAVMLSINLDADPVGYRCEGSQEVLDFSKLASYEPGDFFKPIPRPSTRDEGLELRRGDFYILATAEALAVPPTLAAEMVPIDIRAGDFRVQYAGFFDPGWGLGPAGTLRGAPAVLEVRSFEDNLLIRAGQSICKVNFERMATTPDTVYGQAGNSYLAQRGPRLSKHFR